MQNYKNIYFPDAPGNTSKERNVTIAFGPNETDISQLARSLSSEQLRNVLGHQTYRSLKQASEKQSARISSYVKTRLRSALRARQEDAVYDAQVPGTEGLFDSTLATYRGGANDPLHTWFPYLEGFSPGFVRRLLDEHAPKAQMVLDPFGGTGTTAITAAQMGKTAVFCEVNPLLNFVVGAKKAVLRLDKRENARVVASLRELATRAPDWGSHFKPDSGLKTTYDQLFDGSVYFSPEQLRSVLITRAALDDVCRAELIVGQLAIVAALASLLGSSNLIRRGDVRFKNAEEVRRPTVNFLESVARKLLEMSSDLETLSPVSGEIVQLGDDAAILGRIPPAEVDVVLTSPPYLNGTNYIRNTKIELWFMRVLMDTRDLRHFRTKTVTSGINDVNNDRSVSDRLPKSIQSLSEKLRTTAYDPRIARMVSGYFTDLRAIFRGVLHHLRPDAKVIIDIGDSEYAGIHVPTHLLLDDLLRELGLEMRSVTTLRQRRSRAGTALSQTLRVYSRGKRVNGHIRSEALRLPKTTMDGWQRFKKTLPHQVGELARRNWGNALHSLCSYQGKMKPALAASLVEAFLPRAGKLLDPFAGVGTIPFEAALRGHETWAFDISPVATPVCMAKLVPANSDECGELIEQLSKQLDRGIVRADEVRAAEKIRFNGPLPNYFSSKTFKEVLIARRYFLQNPPKTPSEALVFSCMLHILHGNRPYALSRNSHPLTPFAPTGPSEYRPLIPRLRDKVGRSLAIERGATFVAGKAAALDATHPWPISIDSLDAVITSPPFFDSVRFHLGNWMRLWFAGWELDDFNTKPQTFVDELQRKSFEVYDSILRQSKERLRHGGVLVMHLGKSKKCDMASELAHRGRHWFRTVDMFNETVTHCESHGVRDKGSVVQHQYLVMT